MLPLALSSPSSPSWRRPPPRSGKRTSSAATRMPTAHYNIADPIHVLGYLFRAGAASCLDAADVNDDGVLDVSDGVRTR